MKKVVKTFEKFARPELIDGLELVDSMSVDDFMSKIIDNDLDLEGKIFRLVDYTPQPDRWVQEIRMGINPDTGEAEEMVMYVPESKVMMFKSPFVIFPGNVHMVRKWFYTIGGITKRYTGKFPEKKKAVEESYIVFSGLSVSAMTEYLSPDDFYNVLDTIFEGTTEEEIKSRAAKCTRNYIGYNFKSVLVYEIEDLDTAVEAIYEEVTNTPWDFLSKQEKY